MKCLSCKWEIPAAFFDLEESLNSRDGLFRCPECGATHIRRIAGFRSDGTPEYDVRLWGHPATTRRRVFPAASSSSGGPKNVVAI